MGDGWDIVITENSSYSQKREMFIKTDVYMIELKKELSKGSLSQEMPWFAIL